MNNDNSDNNNICFPVKRRSKPGPPRRPAVRRIQPPMTKPRAPLPPEMAMTPSYQGSSLSIGALRIGFPFKGFLKLVYKGYFKNPMILGP